MAKTIDYSALLQPVTRQELHAFVEQNKLGKGKKALQIFAWIGVALLSILTFFVFIGVAAGASDGIIVLLLLIGMLIANIAGARAAGSLYKRSARVWKFAAANNWTYSYQQKVANREGLIFQIGHSKWLNNIMYAKNDTVSFELGTLRYTTGSGKNQQTHYWSYSAIPLPRVVPHMLLDAKTNNMSVFGKSISNLPAQFKGNQKLQLEGDFNNYFTLFAPKEYERDALYIFTPDVMALLIDKTRAFDVEVIGDRMYLYTKNRYDLRTPFTKADTAVALLQRLVDVSTVLGKKMHSRTDYYADERVGDRAKNIVAPQGKRLKGGIAWVSVIFVVIIIALQVLPQLLALFADN